MSTANTTQVADGGSVPLLALGVWQTPHGPECVSAVRDPLELGYRHIDIAQAYGDEESVGVALRESGIPSEQIFDGFAGEARPDRRRQRGTRREVVVAAHAARLRASPAGRAIPHRIGDLNATRSSDETERP